MTSASCKSPCLQIHGKELVTSAGEHHHCRPGVSALGRIYRHSRAADIASPRPLFAFWRGTDRLRLWVGYCIGYRSGPDRNLHVARRGLPPLGLRGCTINPTTTQRTMNNAFIQFPEVSVFHYTCARSDTPYRVVFGKVGTIRDHPGALSTSTDLFPSANRQLSSERFYRLRM